MLQENPEPFQAKGNFCVLSALHSLKMNNHLFLIAPFGCSLKPGLGNNRLTEPSLKLSKVFEFGLLSGSSYLDTFIIFFKYLQHPKETRERLFQKI